MFLQPGLCVFLLPRRMAEVDAILADVDFAVGQGMVAAVLQKPCAGVVDIVRHDASNSPHAVWIEVVHAIVLHHRHIDEAQIWLHLQYFTAETATGVATNLPDPCKGIIP